MKTFTSPIKHLLPAQEVYFESSSAPRENWCMTVFCATLLLTTLLACFLPVASSVRIASTSATELAAFTPRAYLQPVQEKRIFHQAGPRYHWHFQCPLANHRSLRMASAGTAKKRVFLTQQEAALQELTPCHYCLELER